MTYQENGEQLLMFNKWYLEIKAKLQEQGLHFQEIQQLEKIKYMENI